MTSKDIDLIKEMLQMQAKLDEAITEYLGFTIEDVHKAYCDKNKVNDQRLKEGY